MTDCIFCKIAKGEVPFYKIWEDEEFVAFLDINPDVTGQTIVIPKKHYPSYILEVEDEVVNKLVSCAKKVAKILDTKLENVLRTKFVLEGVEVAHLHIKLYPIYKEGDGEKLSLEQVFEKLTK